MLRTLKVISYRATHFLSFLIIIMVINVYKLKSLTPDERSRGTQTREQTLCTFTLRARARTRRHPPLPARLASLSTLPSFPPPRPPPPQGTARNRVPTACRGGGNPQSSGAGANTPDPSCPVPGTAEVLSKYLRIGWKNGEKGERKKDERKKEEKKDKKRKEGRGKMGEIEQWEEETRQRKKEGRRKERRLEVKRKEERERKKKRMTALSSISLLTANYHFKDRER